MALAMNNTPEFPVLIDKKKIDAAVRRLAAEISRDYRDKNPVLLGVLKGSFIFMADLVRQLDFPLEIEFIRLFSYGGGTHSSGSVKMARGVPLKLKGRHVLVVEDIIDTGFTLAHLLHYLKEKEPASVKLCAFTDKPSRRVAVLNVDYVGFTVPDKFVVGYGLDYAEKYRNLPEVSYLED